MLKRLAPAADITAVNPSEDGPDCLPADVSVEDFDGVVWTGSALNVYDGGPAIERQLRLAEEVWVSGQAVFGSCWGLQLFTAMLGGRVRKNPKGRELGIARDICLTEEGRTHAMYQGKAPAFDALAIHTDEIDTAPAGSVLLASNEMSRWQALSYSRDGSEFWGVQYHPEIDLGVCAVIIRRYGQRLVDAGQFASLAELESTADDWARLHEAPDQSELASRYGITWHVLDRACHERELANWLAAVVEPRRGESG